MEINDVPFGLAEDVLSRHQKTVTSNLVQRRHGLDADSVIVVLWITTETHTHTHTDFFTRKHFVINTDVAPSWKAFLCNKSFTLPGPWQSNSFTYLSCMRALNFRSKVHGLNSCQVLLYRNNNGQVVHTLSSATEVFWHSGALQIGLLLLLLLPLQQAI